MNQAGVTITNNNNPILFLGTNVRSGMPTIPGFPVRDGVEQRDSRYSKILYRNANTYYWVSSEMVSQWFIQTFGRGNGGSHGRQGDANDWLTAGYGDLSFGFNMQCW
jgi:hypothetical protein